MPPTLQRWCWCTHHIIPGTDEQLFLLLPLTSILLKVHLPRMQESRAWICRGQWGEMRAPTSRCRIRTSRSRSCALKVWSSGSTPPGGRCFGSRVCMTWGWARYSQGDLGFTGCWTQWSVLSVTTHGYGVKVCDIMGYDRPGRGGRAVQTVGGLTQREAAGWTGGLSTSSPCVPCPHSGGTAPPWPAGLRPSSAGCPEAPRFADLLGEQSGPSGARQAQVPPTHLAVEHGSLLPSLGGSSSSMYSRFRCSSRSASCSFCLWAGDKQRWWQPRHSQLEVSLPGYRASPPASQAQRLCALAPLPPLPPEPQPARPLVRWPLDQPPARTLSTSPISKFTF